jgi:hypothetical protein
MSKKDRKRIAELERQQSILCAKIRVMREQQVTLRDNFILHLLKEHSPIFEQGSIPQSEPKQGKAEQEKPAQTEPATPEKEQELLAQLNAELAKFASLEAFNAERKNRSLPPVDKLEFDKAKSCFDYALAAAKVLRPQWYDKINQIKVPVSEQTEAEQKQPKTDTPCPRTAALIKMVLGRIKEMEKWLGEREHSTTEIAQAIQVCVDNLGLDLADFRRKFLDLGRVEPSRVDLRNSALGEVEPKETHQTSPKNDSEKQGEDDQPETEKGQVWIVQTNPKKAERLNAFYIDYVGGDNIIRHTPNPNEAMNFLDADAAQTEIDAIIKYGSGRYSADDFKIVKKP